MEALRFEDFSHLSFEEVQLKLEERFVTSAQQSKVRGIVSALVAHHFGVLEDAPLWIDCEGVVLLRDYGFSAYQVATWRKWQIPSSFEIVPMNAEPHCVIENMEQRLSRLRLENPQCFQHLLRAVRAFIYFYFVECERWRMPFVAKQTPLLLKFCGQSFYATVLRALCWSHHDIEALMSGHIVSFSQPEECELSSPYFFA